MNHRETTENSRAPARKAYARPLLRNYGSLTDLTLNGTLIGSDGGICAPGNPDVNPQDNCS